MTFPKRDGEQISCCQGLQVGGEYHFKGIAQVSCLG